MLDILLDSLLDSLKVLAVVFFFYIALSFFETKLSLLLERNKKVSPLLGAFFGILPQCGFSVVAADLYLKRHITVGSLLAVFIACSDEALPILLSSGDKLPSVLPLIGLKLCIAIGVGYLVDWIYRGNKEEVHRHHEHCEHEEEIHIGCCQHAIDDREEKPVHRHLIHPLIHTLKIFIYIFFINLAFGLLFYFIGEDAIISFLSSNRFLSPLFTVIIGLIPNCASSVIITDLFLLNGIPFGACLSGLIVNAGLGMMFLLKNREHRKETLVILTVLIATALISGYLCFLVP